MFKTGLVSITFGNLNTDEIIDLVTKAGLDGIEWGAKGHVPHGDINNALDVGRKTRDAGINVASYGSYYRINETTDFSFDDVLETAKALGTELIRVWAGHKSSADADETYWNEVAEEGRLIADKAQAEGIKIATEWHGGSLTDTAEAATQLFDMVNHDNCCTYWQPREYTAPEKCLQDMNAALPRLAAIHVFNWDVETKEKLPLKEAKEAWKQYFRKAQKAGDMYAMLEFVRDSDPEQFLQDAKTLKELTASVI